MKWSRVAVVAGPLALIGLGAGLGGCGGAGLPPKALVDARSEFAQAKGGVAIQLDPTDVHEADLALQKAEQAWADQPDDPNTIDLAVIAQRLQIRSNDTAIANARDHATYAHTRLVGGIGRSIDDVRAQQDLATVLVQRQTVLTGLAQGLFAAMGYRLTGVPEAAFFGTATAVASLLRGAHVRPAPDPIPMETP